jgi:uncharacterized protein (DUF736 family)
MATIGTFTKSGDDFTGTVKTLERETPRAVRGEIAFDRAASAEGA